MNKAEASAILADRFLRYREWPYVSLASHVGTTETEQVTGPSGVTYQLEFQAIWDGKPGGDVRMIGSIDDGGIRAFVPLSDAFIKAPDGRFVGEKG